MTEDMDTDGTSEKCNHHNILCTRVRRNARRRQRSWTNKTMNMNMNMWSMLSISLSISAALCLSTSSCDAFSVPSSPSPSPSIPLAFRRNHGIVTSGIHICNPTGTQSSSRLGAFRIGRGGHTERSDGTKSSGSETFVRLSRRKRTNDNGNYNKSIARPRAVSDPNSYGYSHAACEQRRSRDIDNNADRGSGSALNAGNTNMDTYTDTDVDTDIDTDVDTHTSRRRVAVQAPTEENDIANSSSTSYSNKESESESTNKYGYEEEDIRVQAIRSTLQNAEEFRKFRIANNFVPQIDPSTGLRNSDDDSKFIVTISAAIIAVSLFAIRIGGRVALISAIGLDFAADNPQYKEYIDSILEASTSMGEGADVLLFLSAWIVTKVLVIDAGAIVLALSSGILFGGVIEGALLSALGSTLGSSVAYSLAKFDTPARKGALALLENYPALRGIDNVVAEDGLKAILTLRLAPILPIPIGAYNYIYGVTKVPYADFAAGIFLGSLKPYLLDSFIGYFASQVVEGTVDRSGYEDLILVVSLLASALIGIFASQLAGESWDSIRAEIDADKRKNRRIEQEAAEKGGYKVVTSIFGIELSDSLIDQQIRGKKSELALEDLVESEFYGNTVMARQDVIDRLNLFEYLALQPALFAAFLKYSDPMIVASKGLYAAQTSSSTSSSSSTNLLNFQNAISVGKSLWFLPLLSLLSGLTPAAKIVAESHVSRMPDTPIAHEIDTFLLWPAIGNPGDRGLPPTIFNTPVAAITDELQYDVDWDAVKEVYVYYLTNSLLVSGLIALSLYTYITIYGDEDVEE